MRRFDVIVVGGGGAGVAAAVAARRAGARVALLSKEPAGYGDTRIAEGAITYPGRSADDSPEVFLRDVMSAGEQLCDLELATTLARDAERGVHDLEDFGFLIRRDSEGLISDQVANRSGGHSIARTVSGSGRGVHIGVSLRAACARAGVSVIEDCMAVRLLTADERVVGVQTYDLVMGEWQALHARTVILATGGTGWLYYPHTDCVRSTTGDGFALALEAGAELVEMEQVQFLPFGLTHPDSMMGIFCAEPGHAGPYGRLLDGEGSVVLEGLRNLNRAQVMRVMAQVMKEGRVGPHGGLFLDLRPNLEHPDGVAARKTIVKGGGFKGVRAAYGQQAYGWKEPLEVLPTAHYHMGGVRVDVDGRTNTPGLFAAGAVQGGVHGGNRLGSVALTEIFVFGRRAGEAAAREALDPCHGANNESTPQRPPISPGRTGRFRPIQLVRRLQKVMWEHAGPLRDENGIGAGLRELDLLEEDYADISIGPAKRCNPEMRDALELQLMLLTARAILASALERRESRGAHLRADFPDRGPQPYRTVTRLDDQLRLNVTQDRIRA